MFDQREKIALLIDGVNLFAASKALGFNIDYRKLLEAFRKRAYLLRANYYAALVEGQEPSSIRPLIAWLDYNGYRVVTKPVREFTDSLGRRKVEGNMDVELAIDAIELAETADHLVIFSGDGNFTSLVAALQRKGRKVSVVSSMSTRPPMISDALRREADHFIDLVKLRAEISRETPERASNGSENRPAVSTPEA
ncbi:NYN domain-containing protein [Sinorhizobium meliloti]|uniref:LabA-like NYN domain-containing protein n=1 Tax=Rhizobium meliloti TaxID=382 RepID=UPI00299D273D|nr:NYN domain-containing protein [Sinorhizobium meliloti]